MAFDYEYADTSGDVLTIMDWSRYSSIDDKFITVAASNAVKLTESSARDLANYLLRWADGIKE